MAKKKHLTPAVAFREVVRAALERLDEPAWLAAHSPLAEAYFLAGRLSAMAAADAGDAPGRALRVLLSEAHRALWPGPLPTSRDALLAATEEARRRLGNRGDEYAFLLLELRYFRDYVPPAEYPAQIGDIPIHLSISSTRFFVHLEEAIDRLAHQVLQLAQPVLRLERPRPPALLLGREAALATARARLQAGQSIAITGAAGVGKTSLAATLAAGWPTPVVFWYTFLPGLNDNLPGLLFALSHFLRQWTPSALWLQLVADQGQMRNPEQLLGILRADLEQLQPQTPLLCFDEVDLLRTSDGDSRSAGHAQLLAFLEALSEMTAVVLVGQHGYIDVDSHLDLTPMDTAQTAALLAAGGVIVQPATVARVHQVTSGLPRLIELVIALIHSGDDVAEVSRLHVRADARPLFHRLWRRLDAAERDLLVSLSVLRRAAPLDSLPRLNAYRSLVDRRVLQTGADGVGVLPFFRGLVYEALPPEQREAAHAQAAELRAMRGDFTAAAYHYQQAGDPMAAVEVWFPHRALEIERGQAGAALTVFSQMSAARLPAPQSKQLRLIQNQLDLLVGIPERVVAGMSHFKWDIDDTFAGEAFRQAAEANFMLGRYETALENYDQALQALGRHAEAMADTYSRRSLLYIDQGELSAARNEARRARFRVLMLEGILAFNEGDYEIARGQFAEALVQVESPPAPDLAAQAHEWLALTAIMVGDVATAESQGALALAHYEQTGNRVKLEGLRADLAGMFLNVRQFERVIEPSERALRFFEAMGHERWVSSICSNLAEAYLETGRLDEAAAHAHRVLQLENPRSRPYALYTLGLVHQRQTRVTYAQTSFDEGIRVAQRNGDRYIEAYLLRSLGRLRRDQAEYAAAAEALSAALALFRRMKIVLEITQTEEDLRSLPPDAWPPETPPDGQQP